jgi:ADP-ribose pyrophosphatase YjhB (NUDIX family)
MTLGVRAVVTGKAGRVLLIEHTYVSGWQLPGGGVERGETAEDALVREVAEEAGVRATSPPVLISIHRQREYPGDHVLLYRVANWKPCARSSSAEIHAVGWFGLDELPPDTTPKTQMRLAELFGGAAASLDW